MKTISLIIPAFNEEQAIGRFLESLKSLKIPCEIIVVNDGSTDNTAGIAGKFSNIILINNKKNKGYGYSLKTGIKRAKGEIVVIADSDGQHTVEDVNKVLEKALESDDDLVIGERTRDSHSPLNRKPGKLILSLCLNFLAGRNIRDFNSGLRAFKREVILKYLHLMPNSFSFSTTSLFALLKSNYDISYVPIKANKRIGKSTVRQFRHGMAALFLIIKLVILFHPIKAFFAVAFPMFLIAVLNAAYNFLILKQGLADLEVMFFTSSIIVFLFGLLTDQISSMRREKYE